MNEDYRSPRLETFINEILNPVQSKNDDVFRGYRRFHAVVYYFEYAVGMVRAQELALKNKEADAMICGSAIAAYVSMHNCCVLIEKGLGDILKVSKNTGISKGIKQIKSIYKDLPLCFNDIRDNLGGHPEGSRPGTDIATKRTMISSDGRVKIGRFLLHPRKDLEKLREFLERIGQLLNQEWKV